MKSIKDADFSAGVATGILGKLCMFTAPSAAHLTLIKRGASGDRVLEQLLMDLQRAVSYDEDIGRNYGALMAVIMKQPVMEASLEQLSADNWAALSTAVVTMIEKEYYYADLAEPSRWDTFWSGVSVWWHLKVLR